MYLLNREKVFKKITMKTLNQFIFKNYSNYSKRIGFIEKDNNYLLGRVKEDLLLFATYLKKKYLILLKLENTTTYF